MRIDARIMTLAAAMSLLAPAGAGLAQDATPAVSPGDVTDTNQEVAQATDELRAMQADPDVANLLQQARGVYLLPEFGRGALVVGIRGGSGLLLTHENGQWSSPAFYNLGGISVGAQAGGSGGRVAFILMSQAAVDQFKDQNSFSLNADAGLSIINYSANAQASWGKNDIVLWSDTAGLFAGVEISATDISWDGDANRAYYGADVTPSQVMTGKLANPPEAADLDSVLATIK